MIIIQINCTCLQLIDLLQTPWDFVCLGAMIIAPGEYTCVSAVEYHRTVWCVHLLLPKFYMLCVSYMSACTGVITASVLMVLVKYCVWSSHKLRTLKYFNLCVVHSLLMVLIGVSSQLLRSLWCFLKWRDFLGSLFN